MNPIPPDEAKKKDDSWENTKKTDRSALYFSRAVDYIPDALITTDNQHVVISWNAAAEQIYGWKAEEVIGKSLNDVFQTSYQNTDQDEAAKAVRETGAWSGEVSQLRKDGTRIPIWSSISVFEDEDGHTIGFIGINRNITERKQAEMALIESEKRLITAQHIAKMGDFTWDVETGEVIWSDALFVLLGYDKCEKNDYARVNAEIHHPDDLERVTQWLNDCIASGQEELTPNEYRLIRKDGEVIYVRTVGVIEREEGKSIKVFATAQDITERVQVEEALRESEEMSQLFIRYAPAAIAMFDREMHYIAVSHRWISDYHLRESDLIGKSHYDIFPEITDQLKEVHRRGLSGEVVKGDEDKFERADGSIQWLRWEMRPWIAADGSIGGIVILSEDITEHKRAEQTVRESEERFRKVFEEGPIGMVLTSHDLKFFSANPAFCQMLGYTAEEMNSKTFLDVTHPDHREIDRENVEKMWQGEIPHYSTRKRYIAKNGDIRWGSLSTSLIRRQDGEPFYALAMVEDITERKRAEEALAASEAELRALFASMQDVVLVIDREGVYRKIAPTNPGLLYKPPQELLGQNLRNVFSAEQAETFVSVIQQTLDTGQTTRVEYELAIGEHSIWFSTSISPMDADSTLWVAHDITEKKQTETEIRRRADEFAALYDTSMSLSAEHDSNTLVQTIVENAAIILNAYAGGMYLYDPIREDLEVTFTTDPSMPVGTRLHLGEGVAGRVAQTHQSMRIEDYSTWEGRSQKYEGIAIRATIEVPMLYKGELIGVLVAHEVGASERQFTKADEHLLSLFASQAAAAIQNNRLLEQERARARELSTLYEATKTISSDLALESVLETVAEKMAQILHSDGCTLSILNRERDTLVTLVDFRTKHPVHAESKGVIYHLNKYPASRRVLESGQPLAIDPKDKEADQSELAYMMERGLTTLLMLPLMAYDQVNGLVEVYEEEAERVYKQEEIQLLQNLAAQAAISIENARLFEDAQRRLRQTKALREIDQAITGSMDMQHVLKIVLKHTISELGVDAAVILLFNPKEQSLHYELGSGFRADSLQFTHLRLGEGYAGRAALGKQTIYSRSSDTQYRFPALTDISSGRLYLLLRGSFDRQR